MIQSVERAVEILRLVSESPGGARLCELSAKCGLKRNTVYNLADTLVAGGMLEKTGDARYVVGPLVRKLAGSKTDDRHLAEMEAALARLHRKHPQSSIYYSELGDSDILARFHLMPGETGRAAILRDITLNPYITVAGLVFFAFGPEERLTSLRIKNPFDFKGADAWGDISKFDASVRLTRESGHALTPHLTPAGELKVGIPVPGESGVIRGVVTYTVRPAPRQSREKIIADIKEEIRAMNLKKQSRNSQ